MAPASPFSLKKADLILDAEGESLTMLEKARSKPRHSSKTSFRPDGASPSVETAFSTAMRRSVRRSTT
jgi:hypothetical protein